MVLFSACCFGSIPVLITIAMVVGGTEFAFSTCHQCEAKWWFKDGEPVQLSSVIGMVGVR